MALIGYARVSTTDQNFDLQVDALIKAVCTEKQSGTTIKGCDKLASCLCYMCDGGTRVITRIDRLALQG